MRKKDNTTKTKGLNIMELNETQKSVVDILYTTYKSDTVTRSQINDLVKSKKIKNPSWLKSDKYKVGRGSYKLPMGTDEVETEIVETEKTESQAAYIVSSLTDNVVPLKDKDFVSSVSTISVSTSSVPIGNL